ncbi:hypothetical protein O3M35_004421 [Rhynocoris fuscipes]|uniref:Uncharacterized protein n=1 Tax=Rhynocoris fuscipes TaxID=488301 RepID=A0AAW1CHC0_9HEMI
MMFTLLIPGESQGMRLSSHLTVIATWRTYWTPLYGTSRMIKTKSWRSPTRKSVYRVSQNSMSSRNGVTGLIVTIMGKIRKKIYPMRFENYGHFRKT